MSSPYLFTIIRCGRHFVEPLCVICGKRVRGDKPTCSRGCTLKHRTAVAIRSDRVLSISETERYCLDLARKYKSFKFNDHAATDDMLSSIIAYTSHLGATASTSERVYCIIYNIRQNPLCGLCGNPVAWDQYSKGYHRYCSVKCSSNSLDKKVSTARTCLDKFGHQNAFHSPKGRDSWEDYTRNPERVASSYHKVKQTKLLRYGDPNYVNAPRARETYLNSIDENGKSLYHYASLKAQSTKLARYGHRYYRNTPKSLETKGNNYYRKVVQANSGLGIEVITPLEEFLDKINPSHSLLDFRCLTCKTAFQRKAYYTPKCPQCTGIASSIEEKTLGDFISTLGISYVKHARGILGKKYEIDFYIPERKIGIEYNGIYWHSESSGKDKDYHLNKTELSLKAGIHLIHVFSNEWANKRQIVESVLRAKLGKVPHRIFARKCTIREVPSNEKAKFLDANHLQGRDNSSIALGLYLGEELVSVMTFGSRSLGRGKDFELIRFANKLNTSVLGGASKLLKYFKDNFDFSRIKTYADRRWSQGDFYEKLGFKLSHVSKPNYHYTNNYKVLESRLKFQKHKLEKALPIYDPSMSEWENMRQNGYDRVWDCGNYIYYLDRGSPS